MTQDNRLWVLMSRRLSGEATPEEVDELMQLLERSPQKQYLYGVLHSWFTGLPAEHAGDPAEDPDWEERFHKIIAQDFGDQPRRLSPRKRIIYITSIAASITAVILFAWNIHHQRSSSKPASAVTGEEVLVRPGTRTRLLLPDGTLVWLNSNSKLRYSNEFNKEVREVGLEGEAYFDVAKNAKSPFIVHASTLDIKVLGTAFTIKSYPQDPTIETTLLNGAIEVSRKDNPNTARVILKPNEKLVFNKAPLPASPTPNRIDLHSADLPNIAVNTIRNDIPDSDKVETAWMYNRLVFRGDNFREVAEKMERWYNVRITIRDSSLINTRIWGAFASETVEQALTAIQYTKDFTYKINGNDIELYAKR